MYFVSLIFFFFCLLLRLWCETFFFPKSVSFCHICKISDSLALVHSFFGLTDTTFLFELFCVRFRITSQYCFFYWCSLNFGRVYIKPWKKRILCVNLWWFWCCERSNALKKINRRSEFITHHKNQRISWKRQIKLANKCKIIWSWWMSSRFLHKNEFNVSVVSIGAI